MVLETLIRPVGMSFSLFITAVLVVGISSHSGNVTSLRTCSRFQYCILSARTHHILRQSTLRYLGRLMKDMESLYWISIFSLSSLKCFIYVIVTVNLYKLDKNANDIRIPDTAKIIYIVTGFLISLFFY